MPTYIEKEALLKALNAHTDYGDDGKQEINADIVFLTIEEFPAADVAPIKHGEWVPNGEEHCVRCSICGIEDYDYLIDYKFCPECGSKMSIN